MPNPRPCPQRGAPATTRSDEQRRRAPGRAGRRRRRTASCTRWPRPQRAPGGGGRAGQHRLAGGVAGLVQRRSGRPRAPISQRRRAGRAGRAIGMAATLTRPLERVAMTRPATCLPHRRCRSLAPTNRLDDQQLAAAVAEATARGRPRRWAAVTSSIQPRQARRGPRPLPMPDTRLPASRSGAAAYGAQPMIACARPLTVPTGRSLRRLEPTSRALETERRPSASARAARRPSRPGRRRSRRPSPATNTSAPASAQRSMVSSETPPSTWSQVSTPCLSISCAGAPDLGQAQVEELLAAEARLDGHDQHHVELGEQVLVGLDRRGRLERHAGPRARGRGSRGPAAPAPAAASTWKVTEPQPASTYARRVAVGVLDHQVRVERARRSRAPGPRPWSARRSGWARSGCP